MRNTWSIDKKVMNNKTLQITLNILKETRKIMRTCFYVAETFFDREDTCMVKLPIVAADQMEVFVEKGKASVQPTRKSYTIKGTAVCSGKS